MYLKIKNSNFSCKVCTLARVDLVRGFFFFAKIDENSNKPIKSTKMFKTLLEIKFKKIENVFMFLLLVL